MESSPLFRKEFIRTLANFWTYKKPSSEPGPRLWSWQDHHQWLSQQVTCEESRAEGQGCPSISREGREFLLKWERLRVLQHSPGNWRRTGVRQRLKAAGVLRPADCWVWGICGSHRWGYWPEEPWVSYHLLNTNCVLGLCWCFICTISLSSSTWR